MKSIFYINQCLEYWKCVFYTIKVQHYSFIVVDYKWLSSKNLAYVAMMHLKILHNSHNCTLFYICPETIKPISIILVDRKIFRYGIIMNSGIHTDTRIQASMPSQAWRPSWIIHFVTHIQKSTLPLTLMFILLSLLLYFIIQLCTKEIFNLITELLFLVCNSIL